MNSRSSLGSLRFPLTMAAAFFMRTGARSRTSCCTLETTSSCRQWRSFPRCPGFLFSGALRSGDLIGGLAGMSFVIHGLSDCGFR